MNMNPVATLTNRKMTLDIKTLPARLGRNNNVVEVYLFHESVSREHCLFECINRRFTVRDLGSTVGTFINGVRLEPNIPYNIEDGSKIQFGKVKMVFHADYQALAEWERMQAAPAAQAPSQGYGGSEPFAGQSYGGGFPAAGQNFGGSAPAAPSSQDFGGSAPSAPGNKNIKVSIREMNEYEYDEDEVVYIECGLKPEDKSLSYTSELRKKELEAAIAKEADQADWKSTQVLSADESASLAAAVEAASEAQAEAPFGEPFEAPAEEPAEEIEASIAGEESQADWKSTQVLSADESASLAAAVEAASEGEAVAEAPIEEPAAEDISGSVFADEGTFKIEDQQDEEQAKKTLVLTWIDDITGDTKKLKIDHFPFAIGRKSDVNDYTIARKGISRKHMRFDEAGGEIYVYDDASTNGVRVNGEKIAPETQVKLNSGDTIRVLDITFAVTIN